MNQAEFEKRLQETFRLEAQEHVQAMVDCLLHFERDADEAEKKPYIETIFREAHSLKGAARAVNNAPVESLCHHMESCFSSMKRHQRLPAPAALDTFHRAVDLLAALLDHPEQVERKALSEVQGELAAVESGIVPSGVEQLRGQRSMGEEVSIFTYTPAPVEQVAAVPEPAATEPAPARAETKEPPAPKTRPGFETIRTPVSMLEGVLRQAEALYALSLEQQEIVPRLNEVRLRMDSTTETLRSLATTGAGMGASGDAGRQVALHRLEDLGAASVELALTNKAAFRSAHVFRQSAAALFHSIRELQMLPFAMLFESLPKTARDIAREQGKQVEIFTSGEEISVDKQVLETLRDPLIHLIRNAIDHGMETPQERTAAGKPAQGAIHLEVAQRSGGAVELLVEDDGRGINVEKVRAKAVQLGIVSAAEAESAPSDVALNWIFASGLSTSPMITDLSGRGLGMAIVREKVEALGGSVLCESNHGNGTRFRLTLPVSLSALRAIEVAVGRQHYYIPVRFVTRALNLKTHPPQSAAGAQTVLYEEKLVPLVPLADLLELTSERKVGDQAPGSALVLEAAGVSIAIAVDSLHGESEILVKRLAYPLERVRNVAGSAIHGTGEPVLVLNAPDLVRSAIALQSVPTRRPEEGAHEEERGLVLVADDSLTSRMLLRDILLSAGYRVETAVDGMDAFTKLREQDFDALVSDVDMPRMSGFELTQKVRADSRLTHLPVVLVTSLSSREDHERGIEVGANAYIVKSSFDQSNLLEVLQRLA